MKSTTTGPGGTFVIRSPDRGRTWSVLQLAEARLTSAVIRTVWAGTDYREARSRHAAAVRGLPIRQARKLTN